MLYFYLKTAEAEGGVRAQVGGIYRDDILASLLPEGDLSMVLANLSAAGMQVLQQKKAGQKRGDQLYAVTSRKDALEVIHLFGPARSLSQEEAGVFIYAGGLPEDLDTLKPQDAHAVVKLADNRRSVIEVPDATRFHSMVGRALTKLMSRHLRKAHRVKLWKNAGEILQPAIEGIVTAAQGEGITVNNFPGPHPGLCTLWFVTGSELTLERRRELAASPPDSLEVGEITLTADWTAAFREKAVSMPEVFAAYLRLSEEKTKAACGCVSLLASGAIGIIPAAIYGGKWWLLPLSALAGALALGLGSQLALKLKKRALALKRREA